MSSYKLSSDVKVPIRAAPLPPANISWASSIFNPKERPINNGCNTKVTNPKKKPPPRPPPPKLKQAQSTDPRNTVVGGLFPQRSLSRPIYEPVSAIANSGSLIDWNSPPSSPTSTTRSSSDALSVNSFGSDSVTPCSGNSSNVESGFEDDFDLFCAPVSRSADPWKSPSPVISAPPPTAPNSSWVAFSSPTAPKKLNMPTIIRSKPERPKPPKVLEKKMELDALTEVFQQAKISVPVYNIDESGNDDDWDCDSPPMPTIPPPAPPPELLAHLLTEAKRNDAEVAVALYDYTGAAGDLSFRQGDRIVITRHIDENWYEGELKGRRGTVPANFLQMDLVDPRLVRALYAFTAETWEDLSLEPGLQVRLLGRVNNDWLYGEANGRRGQLPGAFVSNVPVDLPQWKS